MFLPPSVHKWRLQVNREGGHFLQGGVLKSRSELYYINFTFKKHRPCKVTLFSIGKFPLSTSITLHFLCESNETQSFLMQLGPSLKKTPAVSPNARIESQFFNSFLGCKYRTSKYRT